MSTETKVFYLHTEPLLNLRGRILGNRATIACKTDGQTIKFGYAICSEDDNFSKEKGRKLAEERMNNGFGQVKFNNNWFEHFPTQESALLNFATTQARSIRTNFEKYKRKIAASKGIQPTPKQVKTAHVSA